MYRAIILASYFRADIHGDVAVTEYGKPPVPHPVGINVICVDAAGGETSASARLKLNILTGGHGHSNTNLRNIGQT